MEQPATIGIDPARTVFQGHGVDAAGAAVVRRKLRRGQVLEVFARLDPCPVGMEACAGAHCWARELLELGHEVRIMPPSCVKPHVKRGKTDAADAAAICEAVTRPTMRVVPVTSAERQAALPDHKTRDFLVRQRTQPVNTIRAQLSGFGPRGPRPGRNAPPERFMRARPHPSPSVVARGIHDVDRLLAATAEPPAAARPAVDLLADQRRDTQEKIDDLTDGIEAARRTDPLARHLATIPGVGAISASAIAASRQRRASRTTPEACVPHDARGRHLPLRPRLRRLARPHATAAFQRRQG